MTRRNVWPAVLAALSLAAFARADAPETVKLEYQLKPGLELMFNSSGTAKYCGKPTDTFNGAIRCVVGEADEKSGSAPMAQMGPLFPWAITRTGPAAKQANQADLTFCRVDGAQKETLWNRCRVILTPLPADAVAVGAKWKGAMDFRTVLMAPMNVEAVVESVLAEIKVVDGRKCAVIKSKLTAPSNAGPGRFVITGEMRTIFDVEAGVCRSQSLKLHAQHPDAFMNHDLELSTILASSRELPKEQADVEVNLIKTLEAVTGDTAARAFDKAQDRLKEVDQDKLPDEWKAGFKALTQRVGVFAPKLPNAAPGVGAAPGAT